MSVTGERYRSHGLETHLIRARAVDQTYRISVFQPVSRSDGSERFPVVYMTDADELFGGCAALAASLQFYGETPRFILVGIGYEHARQASLLRMRDFYSPEIRQLLNGEIAAFARSPLGSSTGIKTATVTATTGAKQFLGVLRAELMPFMETRYPALKGDRTYFGFSSGGAFGLQTLFTQPETFGRYILGSPVCAFKGHDFGCELAKRFMTSGRTLNAQVFISVGELEERAKGLDRFELVSGSERFVRYLKSVPIPGLSVTRQVFAGETHATSWPLAFTRGLKSLFGPVGPVPFRPDDAQ